MNYGIPEDMQQYLSFYGYHFNKKLYETAVRKMRKRNKVTDELERLTPIDVDNLVKTLNKHHVEIQDSDLYDAAYLASMVEADFWGSSIEDEEHMARYIKDVICDEDGYEGLVMCRFLADCSAKGNVIHWDRML